MSSPLTQPNDWLFTQKSKSSQFNVKLEFKPGRKSALGSGTDDKGQAVELNLKLQPEDMYNWLLLLDMGDHTIELEVQSLKFDNQR